MNPSVLQALTAAIRSFWALFFCSRGVHWTGPWRESQRRFQLPGGSLLFALTRNCKGCGKSWAVYPGELKAYEEQLKTRYIVGVRDE